MTTSRLDWNRPGAILGGRLRCPVWRLRAGRIGISAICGSPDAADAAGLQSIDPLHDIATELHANRAYDAEWAGVGRPLVPHVARRSPERL